jgi:hypothetical protein
MASCWNRSWESFNFPQAILSVAMFLVRLFSIFIVLLTALGSMQYYSVGGLRQFDLSSGLQVYAVSSREGFVEPSLKLEKVGDVYVPLQNGIVYPSFELQKSRQYVDLGGEWRVYFDPYTSHDLTLMYRSADVLKELSKDGFHLLTYDDSSWEVMQIPSSLQSYR